MGQQEHIREKLEKLEALFARGATEGERVAAGAALDRLNSRLDTGAQEEKIEFQYSLPDVWAVKIFVALCRKHGVHPYRYPRQRRTTVMVNVQKSVFEQTVMAEFEMLHAELVAYFKDTVDHLIADAMKSDGEDANLERPQIGR
ncbi:hypothetical protein [Roseisalinus antarcticus]|jgi:hypothetical protein|uniref:DUF2786 domain-containing protein n=1 Tax=Roseisalinus antarcticus TaxID=254357 RepID=A0A1Y5U6S5_9RHOB|nr:hypothetical protein [Roseisalinus antarcticus]SLN77990.1 hypothetical protein ROA7023_04636 [Roseisalinus antarcticus]